MQKAASLAATLAALALLGAVLAYWSWAWLAPAPASRAPAAVEIATNPASAASLFGTANQTPAGSASGAVRLMGLVAPTNGGRGRAVLRLDAKKTVSVLQGEEVEPGLRLAEVHVDHIVLERNGARETLAWPDKKGK